MSKKILKIMKFILLNHWSTTQISSIKKLRTQKHTRAIKVDKKLLGILSKLKLHNLARVFIDNLGTNNRHYRC